MMTLGSLRQPWRFLAFGQFFGHGFLQKHWMHTVCKHLEMFARKRLEKPCLSLRPWASGLRPDLWDLCESKM
jgi:hypothetical protein